MAVLKFRTRLLVFNLSVLGGITALAGLLGWDFVRMANLPGQQGSINDRARLNIRQLNEAVQLGLATNKESGFEDELKRFQSDMDLEFAAVYNKAGERKGFWLRPSGKEVSLQEITGDEKKKDHKPETPFLLDSDTIAVWLPVHIESERLGTVALGYSLQRINSAHLRTYIFIGVVVLGFLLSVLASLWNATQLTRPILRMRDMLKRMAKGELGLSVVEDRTSEETRQMAEAFNNMLSRLQELAQAARQVADGNLALGVPTRGDLADAFRQMIQSQRALVLQIAQTAVQLNASMAEFQSSAEQQQRGAIEQSSAVEENQRTMAGLLESARQVADTAQGVLQFAEKTHGNSRQMAERIGVLSSHVQRITEILQVIKDIANKSDLLALNAALEGTKAGEAGRGFSLVATQMQRLAENVVAAVRDIKDLTDTIIDSTRTTVLATEESTKLAADTTRSARQIVMISHQQQAGTEEMTRAMDDVAQIAREAASGSKQIVSSAKDMVQLSAKLQELVGRFQLGEPDRRGGQFEP